MLMLPYIGNGGKNFVNERLLMPRIIRNAIRCKKCGDIIESLSFAAVVRVLWMAATITFADAEIVRIGKSCLKRKGWKTTAH